MLSIYHLIYQSNESILSTISQIERQRTLLQGMLPFQTFYTGLESTSNDIIAGNGRVLCVHEYCVDTFGNL